MTTRTFHLYDTSIIVSVPGVRRERRGQHEMKWNAPNYETFNRLLDTLRASGFKVGLDPEIQQHYPTLSRYHRIGSRPTPHGELSFHAEASPIGCKVEFYQDVVTVNCNGGRYDFDRRQKMPYLVGKAFEAALRAVRGHLIDRGFAEVVDSWGNTGPTGQKRSAAVPAYTASLDAAMTLVPDGARIIALSQGMGTSADPAPWFAKIGNASRPGGLPTCSAATPALALTAACLKARAGTGDAS